MKPLVFAAAITNAMAGSVQGLGLWLNALAVVQRPTRFVHIGIGDGQGESSVWTQWSFTKALAIDAEPITSEVLSVNSQSDAFIDLRSNVIAASEGRVAYFIASNPSENGLLDPSLLRMVWPSLTLSHQTQRDATTLDHAAADMLNVSKDADPEPLWLIVDALPGVSILSGGSKLLEASSLVCVRALAEAGFRGEPVGADLAAVDRFFEGKGFARVIYIPSLNPKIGHALYACKQVLVVTNPAEIEALQVQTQAKETALQQLAEAKKTAEALTVSLQLSSENRQALQVKFDVMLHERDTAVAASATLDSQLHEQTQAKEAALHQLAQANESAEALTVSLYQSTQNQQALQAQLEATAHERDAAQVNIAALGAQLQDVTLAREAISHQLAHATQAKETALRQFSDMQQSFDTVSAKLKATETDLEKELGRVQRLSVENQELMHRQQLMNEELVKAEGQISLIKDLLLREQSI
jgi:hypothetical protein